MRLVKFSIPARLNLKPAILIIDMVNDYFKEGRLRTNKTKLARRVNELSKWGRTNKIPIIWIRNEFKPDLSDAFPVMQRKHISICIKGTGGENVLPELDRRQSDFEIIKKRYSAFFKTKLEKLLRKLEINTLILTGINTHACIRTTAIDAYSNNYYVFIPREAVDSHDLQHQQITLSYLMKSGIAEVESIAYLKSRFNAKSTIKYLRIKPLEDQTTINAAETK